MNKKIIVFIPAYNAGKTITSVFSRLPKDFAPLISEFLVINDCSTDDTKEKLAALRASYPNLTVVNRETNRGYAQAQKLAYNMSLEKQADIVVMLHADGQYAPEELPRLIQPLLDDTADIVQGSRMLGNALRGGMPFYKYVANRVLSFLENLVFGMRLAEFHSGYMLYSKKALRTIPFEKLSDTFHIDGEMLFVGHMKKLRIMELPIPTRYADEKSHLKPIQYGFDVLAIMVKYLSGKYNFKD